MGLFIMGPIEIIEKFINEHGSANILKEHVALLKAQIVALESKVRDLESEKSAIQLDNNQKAERVRSLQSQLHPPGHCCDHCGGHQLKRTGNIPDPIFGDMGVKRSVFSCLECGKESIFTQN
jgi:hypothetical protein